MFMYSSVISPLLSNKMAMRETTGSTPLINSFKIQGFINVEKKTAGVSQNSCKIQGAINIARQYRELVDLVGS
jgi:hypothetical protein